MAPSSHLRLPYMYKVKQSVTMFVMNVVTQAFKMHLSLKLLNHAVQRKYEIISHEPILVTVTIRQAVKEITNFISVFGLAVIFHSGYIFMP